MSRGAEGLVMAHRADVLAEANRAWVRNELIAAGLSPEQADALCAAWEAEARRLKMDERTADFWTLGSVWIREHRGAAA